MEHHKSRELYERIKRSREIARQIICEKIDKTNEKIHETAKKFMINKIEEHNYREYVSTRNERYTKRYTYLQYTQHKKVKTKIEYLKKDLARTYASYMHKNEKKGRGRPFDPARLAAAKAYIEKSEINYRVIPLSVLSESLSLPQSR